MTSSSSPTGPVIVHVFGRTDVGRTRDHNEDAFVIADLTRDRATLLPEVRTHEIGERGSLFMVADGMGGAAAGELASQMATEVVLNAMQTQWRDSERYDAEAFAHALRTAAEAANTHIHDYATKHPENRGMGSTATIAGVLGDTIYLAQIGDSRGYLVRGGVAYQITRDQSLVQRLVEAGELTVEEAEQSERKNIILQALGPEANVKVDLTHQVAKRGDVLILCSDGMSGQVRTDEIGPVIAQEVDLVNVCKRLIDMANEAGGPDNITVVAVRFDGAGLEPANGSDDIGHHIFHMPSENRPTMPVAVVVDDEETRVPTLEIPPVPVPPPAEMRRAARPTPRGPGIGTLRLVFIGIGVIIAGIVVAFWTRN